MEEVAESQIYRLYLSTWTGFPNLISNGDKANVSWQVDFDSLFNRENYNYKNCRLRYKLVSDPATNTTHINNKGVLVVSGLSSRYTSKNTSGLVLDNIIPFESTMHGWFDITTMSDVGVDITVPYGLSIINPQLWDSGFGSTTTGNTVLQTFTAHYTLVLSFELYNHK
jgi:hypothetical protein